MAVTNFDLVRSKDYATFVAAVIAKIGASWKIAGEVFKDIDGFYNVPMVEGSASATFEDLDDRVTAAEALLAATAGTAAASKAVILDANRQVDGVQDKPSAVTATTGGGTTGLIPAKSRFVVVTSDSADKQISLPAADVGDVIRIKVGGTACELISAVAAHKVNDVVVGATNEAALVADAVYTAEYVATNTWILTGRTKLGAAIAAIVPDAL